VSNT